jgi:parallel beta-helix repeat protein
VQGKLILVLVSLLFLASVTSTRFSGVKVDSSDEYRVHNLNTGLNYTSIQEAIDANATLDGHTIFVEGGTYYEHVAISKSIALLGESMSSTTIDGNGTGTVVDLVANNVTVAGFSIRNGGYGLSPFDSCIHGSYRSDILIENNTIMNAACGVIFYGFSNSAMTHNFVEECGLMGMHIDGSSVDCKIVNNTVTRCLEGIEIERSSGNLVEGNQLLYNNASIVLNSCNGSNVLRKNNMTSEWYNLIVWGSSLVDFTQSIDTSNVVNTKMTYYITNSHDLTVDPNDYPSLGYLAVVNCTGVAVRDIDLSSNRDGLLIVQSTNCTLSDITLSGNHGPLLQGGLTFFESNYNLVINTRVINNSVGVCFYLSNGNLLYHNSIIDNDKQVVSNLYSPLSAPQGANSVNKWDNGLEGNYWSSYAGADSDHDGIGDTPYTIDENNTDNHPLMGIFQSFNVSVWGPGPGRFEEVDAISNSTIGSVGLWSWLTTPNKYFQVGQFYLWFLGIQGQEGTVGFCRAMIPNDILNTSVYVALVGMNVLNVTKLPVSNSTDTYLYFTYSHPVSGVMITIPEFQLPVTMLLFITATFLASVIRRRKERAR